MSYQLGLDEMNTDTIAMELSRRVHHFNSGKCHYCGKKLGEDPTCKLYATHRGDII